MMKENGNRLLVWLYQAALFVGTVAVTVLFVHYGMSMFYPAPEYDDFCDNTLAQPTGNLTENQCLEIGGNWQPQSNQLVPENQKENKMRLHQRQPLPATVIAIMTVDKRTMLHSRSMIVPGSQFWPVSAS